MTLIDPETRVRVARWGIPASFVVLLAIGAVAEEVSGLGFFRHGFAMPLFAIPVFFLAFPTAVALLIFAVARGPALATLSGLAALLGFGWSALGAWDIFASHSSTAAIGIVLLPGFQLFILAGIAVAGATLDGVMGLVRKRAR